FRSFVQTAATTPTFAGRFAWKNSNAHTVADGSKEAVRTRVRHPAQGNMIQEGRGLDGTIPGITEPLAHNLPPTISRRLHIHGLATQSRRGWTRRCIWLSRYGSAASFGGQETHDRSSSSQQARDAHRFW